MVVPMPPNPTKENLLKLMSEKDIIEAKIAENGLILEANDNVGMRGSLIDADGFPRDDIDVYQVRMARQQIICLQNDYKALMKRIEELLHKLHAEGADEKMDITPTNIITNGNGVGNGEIQHEVVIAIVNFVSPRSPAEEAGLRVGDGLIEFGTVNHQNFENNLTKLRDVAEHMQNRHVKLKVKRNEQILEMSLIPKTWSGRGLLGCNIVIPTSNSQVER